MSTLPPIRDTRQKTVRRKFIAGNSRFAILRGGRGAPSRLAWSPRLVDALAPVAARILQEAKRDPNPTYAENVYMRVDRKNRKVRSRVRWIITLPSSLEKMAIRVEAKRGTMRRASKAGG